MADIDPCVALKEADLAWVMLNMGGAVREITDQNGERVVYTSANRAGLLLLIKSLQPQCPQYTPVALGAGTQRPLGFVF